MDRIQQLTVVVAVAEEGAFNAAARRLGQSPAAITRAVAALEARLGARLFRRTTRRVTPTEAGAAFAAEAARILADLAAAETAVAGAHGALTGTIRLTAPVVFGQRFVAPVIRDFLELHSRLEVEASFADRVVDLGLDPVDAALRIGDTPGAELMAIRIGSVRRVVVAAPALVARLGHPGTPAELARWPTVGQNPGRAEIWEFVAGERRSSVRIAPRLRFESFVATREAAEAGFGAARLPSYQVADAIAAGRLIELVPGADTRELPVRLLHQEGRQAPARLRAFLDFAVPRLRAHAPAFAARPVVEGTADAG